MEESRIDIPPASPEQQEAESIPNYQLAVDPKNENVESNNKGTIISEQLTSLPKSVIHRIGGIDKNTEYPEPHPVFSFSSYPKTGGRLGRNVLLWGNELKHSFFPLVCLVGPDWITMLFTYAFMIAALSLDTFLIHHLVGNSVVFFLVLVLMICVFWILLTTTLSDQGIIWRGCPDLFSLPKVSTCRICEVDRPKGACHCEVCEVCSFDVVADRACYD